MTEWVVHDTEYGDAWMTPLSPEEGTRVLKELDLRDLLTAMGIVAGLWAFARLVFKPVLRALWREVHAEEVKKWDEAADRLEWIEASVLAKSKDYARIEARLEVIGDAVNRICGRMDEPWDRETERRLDIRRRDDKEREA